MPEIPTAIVGDSCVATMLESKRLNVRMQRGAAQGSRPLTDLIDGVEIAMHEQARMAPTCRHDRVFPSLRNRSLCP